ncbi:MAG: undecaprenyl/decaprenyl-phosphate alpha-N-acetylglucosaminyl 1-phosphate transferase, partial [Sphingobacteriales bacterium]
LIWSVNSPFKYVYLASLVMFVIGLTDDLKPLSAKLRLVVQIAVALFVVYKLNLPILKINFTQTLTLNLPSGLGYVLSVFVIVGAINGINLTDGLDGLAGGVVMIGVVLLSMAYYLVSRDLILIYSLSLPLLGCLLGFLKYNTHPATIFMGDGGSNWLGLIVGVLLVFVLSGSEIQTAGEIYSVVYNQNYNLPFLTGILCVALPVLDTAFVMGRRLIAGKNPMTADKTHFHHTLLFIGLSHSQTVSAIYFLSFVIGVLGLMPVGYPAYNLVWVPWLALGLLSLVLYFSLRVDENAADQISVWKSGISINKGIWPYYKQTVIYLEIFNRYLIYGILSVVPLVAGIPHPAIGKAAIVGFGLIVISSFARDDQSFFQSFVISVASAVLLTAINFNTLHISLLDQNYNIQFIYNAIFIILLASTVLYILLTFKRRYFIISPTDFLMIFLPLCLLFTPQSIRTEFNLNVISLRSLIFFVAVRILTRRYPGAFKRVRLMCAIGLLYVFLVSVCKLRIIY